MKKYSYLLITFMIATNLNAGSCSGWGAFAGGFFGASLGNALSQPREQVIVQQPSPQPAVQHKVIYRQVPVSCSEYKERPQQKKSLKRKRSEMSDEEIERDESKVWQAKADAERAQTERINAEIELEKLKNNNK